MPHVQSYVRSIKITKLQHTVICQNARHFVRFLLGQILDDQLQNLDCMFIGCYAIIPNGRYTVLYFDEYSIVFVLHLVVHYCHVSILLQIAVLKGCEPKSKNTHFNRLKTEKYCKVVIDLQ